MQLGPGSRAVCTKATRLSRTCLPRCCVRGTQKTPLTLSRPEVTSMPKVFSRLPSQHANSWDRHCPCILVGTNVATINKIKKKNWHNYHWLCMSPVGTALNEDEVVVTPSTLAYVVNRTKCRQAHEVRSRSTQQHQNVRSWIQRIIFLSKSSTLLWKIRVLLLEQ